MCRVLMAGDNDWMAVVGNLRKARNNWMRMTRTLGQEGVDLRILGLFF